MGEPGSHEEALFLEKGMPKATGPPCHHRPQTGGFSQFVPAVTLPTEPPLLTGHVFLIRAICFMGWAIPFSRFHACCFWTPSPWGPFCTSEPPASLASKRNRVLHFNTTDYFKIMFSFPRKRFFFSPCITTQSLPKPRTKKQVLERTHFRPFVEGKKAGQRVG